MSATNMLLTFTEQFADLLTSGVPIRQAVRQMSTMRANPHRLRAVSAEVGAGLEEGRTLSSVLASCVSVRFPAWYTAFVSVAEEHDCITETVGFLAKTLGAKQKKAAAFVGAMVYPLVVVVLCAVCAVWAAVAFPQFFPADADFALGIQSSFALSTLFLLAAVFFVALVAKAVLSVNPCISLMHTLAFLTAKGTSLSESLQCAVPVVENHERLCDAVLAIRERLLRGENIEHVFFEQLDAAGFASAAKIMAAQLVLAQAGATRNVFAETAETLSQKAERVRSSVLACEQPVLLGCAAVYMLILLKNTLMPYITQFGG